jgi:D-serine deaminase-like pyridoxal phosphate-dependent protein
MNTARVHVTSLPTPQVLVDRTRLARNIEAMQHLVASRGKRLRPHAKTHKSPWIARHQLDAGASGICCAKLGEAEVFALAGIDDIRLPYPVHPSNVARVLALLDKVRLSIIVDHAEIARGWSEALVRAGRCLDVLVKVDVGFHRCGVDPQTPDALALVQQVASAPGLRFRGLLSHAGHAYHATSPDQLERIAKAEVATLCQLAGSATKSGIAVEEISVGATPTARFSALLGSITEMRPGNYVYLDRTQVGLQAGRIDDCALTVLARVVSKPAADRIIFDAGSKTLTSDGARGFDAQPGYGAVLDDLESNTVDASLVIERLSEEHATVRVTSGATSLQPGDLVRIVPNHSCVVANLVDEIRLVDGLTVVQTVPVSARGRIA